MEDISSVDIYKFLEKLDLLKDSPPFWWPGYGSFEVVVGAILTQNTTWTNVEKSLKNLRGFLTLDSFILLSEDNLKSKITPSGFYNQKAPRLLALANNIKKEFTTFEDFCKNVTRKWLLDQKGVGEETADAILCYGCKRDEMVVDSYTKRLLKDRFDIEYKKYIEYKEFLEDGIKRYYKEEDLNKIFCDYHGMIVEYNKLLKKEGIR